MITSGRKSQETDAHWDGRYAKRGGSGPLISRKVIGSNEVSRNEAKRSPRGGREQEQRNECQQDDNQPAEMLLYQHIALCRVDRFLVLLDLVDFVLDFGLDRLEEVIVHILCGSGWIG